MVHNEGAKPKEEKPIPAGPGGRSALSIAGFDPGSGAGISADLLTLSRFGVFGTAAITALTVQSTRGVRQVRLTDPLLLRDQLEELEADLPPDGVKIGMLGGAAQVRVVADFLTGMRARRNVTIVVDPVLVSSSGAMLLDQAGAELLRDALLPLADAVTPNAQEAAWLAGALCGNSVEAQRCAAVLRASYPSTTVVLTGGHLDPPSDLVWSDDAPVWLPGRRLDSRATHGTGCVFSSALLAARLSGKDWVEAAEAAKAFVTEAIATATPRGAGYGPTNLLARDR